MAKKPTPTAKKPKDQEPPFEITPEESAAINLLRDLGKRMAKHQKMPVQNKIIAITLQDSGVAYIMSNDTEWYCKDNPAVKYSLKNEMTKAESAEVAKFKSLAGEEMMRANKAEKEAQTLEVRLQKAKDALTKALTGEDI